MLGRSLLIVVLLACGARTPLEGAGHDATSVADAGRDAPRDTAEPDARDASGLDADCFMCRDERNSAGPFDESCVHGTSWLAWEWIPECDMLVSAIQLHTASGGSVAIFADDDGQPGPPLTTGTLGDPDPDGWRRAMIRDVNARGGRRLWIGEQTTDCSLSATGTAQSYWGGNSLRGPWSGPFVDHIWAFKLEGICE